MQRVLLAGLIVMWASVAIAHSPLKSTTPANEAIIAQAPNEIRLDFGKAIRLTRLAVTHADDKKEQRRHPGRRAAPGPRSNLQADQGQGTI